MIQKLVHKSRRPERISKDEIYRLSCEGLTQVKIAEQLGCSKGYVSQVLRNYSTAKKENRLEKTLIKYKLSKEEIECRYGAPGQYAEGKKIYYRSGNK